MMLNALVSPAAFDATRVGPKLWVGRVPPPYLRRVGFDVVALCAEEHQSIPVDIARISVPLRDAELTRPEFARAIYAAKKISDLRRHGQRVLVTCAMGVNRSAFVAALSLMQLDDLSAARAIHRIRRLRGPYTRIMPLSNPSFVEALRRFEDVSF